MCTNRRCVPRSAADAGPLDANVPSTEDAFSCPAIRQCGEACCEIGQTCGGGLCCAAAELCGGRCCGAGQRCDRDRCVLDCGADGLLCGEGASAACCDASQVCYLGGCIVPGPACATSAECPDGQYCETTAGRCLPRAMGTVCEYRPPVGPFELVEEWSWSRDPDVLPTHDQVMMAPMVAHLVDDDGDGDYDRDDVPVVVFSTFRGSEYWADGILRAVRGDTGARLWPTSDPGYRVTPGAEIAIGELDPTSPGPEIAACSASSRTGPTPGHLMLVAADGTLLRRFDSGSSLVPCNFDAPAIADVDGDGVAEVLVRFQLARADGSVTTLRTAGGTGAFYNALADVDEDGDLEIVASSIVYHHDGTVLWDRTSASPLGPAIPLGGYVALGDLDLDGDAELVSIIPGTHAIWALDAATGSTVWGPTDINPLDDPDVARDVAADTRSMGSGGGPPTIANFDADPYPEIAFAGGFAYVIFNHDGTRLWYDVTVDRSSRVTGSSIFDFEGDGIAEVLYNDERTFRVYRGTDGAELLSFCNTSGTLREYPIVADVDADDHAEIILMQNNYAFGCLDGTPSGTGIRVFGHPRNEWVRTRRVWNQHTYSVTNVADDGTVPRTPARNWDTPGLNNFRQNVQTEGIFDAPDLILRDLAAGTRSCPTSLELSVRVVNQGAAGAPAGIPVTFYDVTTGTRVPIGRASTTRRLLPGESELVALPMPYPIAAGMERATFRFEAVLNDPADMPRDDLRQCREDNDGTGPIEVSCPDIG